MIPVIYVAGPYRGQSTQAVQANIQRARAVGLMCCQAGWSPIIPHSNTAHLDAIDPAVGDEFWLAATMELMRRCDAVVMTHDWQKSEGARLEVAEAQRRSLPVFFSIHELPTAAEFLDNLSAEPGKLVAPVVIGIAQPAK